ncbi:hypothetical protein INT43_001089 [Umbelopsis isabellina]|uniref:Uncharacterized protein n=1 Tax=Mortierella isabellina TaxID=91625 RepID=A0A8H7PK13_MORIS|nr:hypothetical protein INT43_001089 [Umbelopsis isabellina]
MQLPPKGDHTLQQCPVRSPCLILVNTVDMTVLVTGSQPYWFTEGKQEHTQSPRNLCELFEPTESPNYYTTINTGRLLYVCAHAVSSPHHMLLLACDVTDLETANQLCLRLTEYGVIEACSMEGTSQDMVKDILLLNRPIMSFVPDEDVSILCTALNERQPCRVRWQVNPATSYWDEEIDDLYYVWADLYVQDHEDSVTCIVDIADPASTSEKIVLSNFTLDQAETQSQLLHMVQMRLMESSLYQAMRLTIMAVAKLSSTAILSITRGIGQQQSIYKLTNQLKLNLRCQENRPTVQCLLMLLTRYRLLDTPQQPIQFVEDILDTFSKSIAPNDTESTPLSIV